MTPARARCETRSGHVWVLLSWKEDPDAAEIERRGAAL